MGDSLSTNASSDSHTVELPQAPSTEGSKGRPFGDYVVEREVARGGMGIVYRARRNVDGSVVALKIIKQGPQASPRQVRRFQRETEAALLLDHPGIVRIYETGCSEGYHFYTMELVEGESLYALLKRKQRLDVNDVLELVALAADAAHYAHEQGVVHRDLKPANILLTPDGRPKLTDFGLAKQVKAKSHLRRTDHVVGTPYYMPPEQARGDMDLDRRADVYALGVILFELLALRVPFEGTTSMEVYQHVLNTNPPSLRELDPRVDERLERIVYQTLAKELGDRYPTALALADDLRRYQRGESIQARAPAWERRRVQRLRRRIALWGGLVAVAAVAAVLVWRSRVPEPADQPPPPEHTAELAAESQRREAFQTAEAALQELFGAETQAGLDAAEAKLEQVRAAVALLVDGGEGWSERADTLAARLERGEARLGLARARLQGPAGDWAGVAERLEAANDTELRVLRARALIGADRLEQARELLSAVLAADPYASVALLARAELALWEGDQPAAQARIKAILSQDPDDPAALALAARLELRRGALREALNHADAWSRATPGDADVAWLRALLAWETADAGALRASLKRLGEHPARVQAVNGMLALEQDDWAAARLAFEAALKHDPGLAEASLGLALAQGGAGERDAALATLAALGERSDPRARWLRSRAAAAGARLLLPAAWLERWIGDDAPSLARAEKLLARARAQEPVAAEAFRAELERCWLVADRDGLTATLAAARAYLGADAADPWAETQTDAEPGLGWLSCWEGEAQRLAGDVRAARRAFQQVRSGPSSVWAAAGREALDEPRVAPDSARPQRGFGSSAAWLAPLQVRTPAVFPRDALGKLARAGSWDAVLQVLEALAHAPAPRVASLRWRGLILLGALPPSLDGAPEVPAELRDPAQGADLLEAALAESPPAWADYGRALIARARGDAAGALSLAEADAETRPTAAGWRLVAALKRAAGDERGAEAAEQRAQGLASQRR
ncbi:MAG: protein kinase [Planctomycetota bacterium]